MKIDKAGNKLIKIRMNSAKMYKFNAVTEILQKGIQKDSHFFEIVKTDKNILSKRTYIWKMQKTP